jgi:hypothetical protein
LGVERKLVRLMEKLKFGLLIGVVGKPPFV